MGIPQRHADAPFIDGERLRGVDLETDISGIFEQLGNIEDINVAEGAGISGTKLADGTVQGVKLVDGSVGTGQIANNAITTQKIAANAVTTAKLASGTYTQLDSETGTGPDAIGTSFATLESNTITLNAGAALGAVLILFRCSVQVASLVAAFGTVGFRLLRDSTQVGQDFDGITLPYDSTTPYAVHWIDTPTPGVSYTYNLQMIRDATHTADLLTRQLDVMEFRR